MYHDSPSAWVLAYGHQQLKAKSGQNTFAGGAGITELFALDGIDRLSMACPALPLCGLAIGEAERTIPDVNRRLRALFDRLGLPQNETVRALCPSVMRLSTLALLQGG